jgi:hypothetical protein
MLQVVSINFNVCIWFDLCHWIDSIKLLWTGQGNIRDILVLISAWLIIMWGSLCDKSGSVVHEFDSCPRVKDSLSTICQISFTVLLVNKSGLEAYNFSNFSNLCWLSSKILYKKGIDFLSELLLKSICYILLLKFQWVLIFSC